jgi:hypothetical protein
MNQSGGGNLAGAGETTVMVVWPTIGATRIGRLVGRLSGVRIGLGGFFTLGKLLALLTIPLSLGVFCWQLLPYVARRYRITNRRIVIGRGLSGVAGGSIGMDEFDEIRVEQLPGQAWLRAGEVLYLRDGRERFRLSGVSRPEVFRRVCLETQMSLASVRRVLEEQSAAR